MTLSYLFIILFFEELIIALLVRFLSIGGGALLVGFFVYISFNYIVSKVYTPRNFFIFIYAFFAFILIHFSFFSNTLLPIPGLLVIVSGICLTTYRPLNNKLMLSKFNINTIYFICIFTTTLGLLIPSLNVYSLVEGVLVSSRPSGLFREPSHAAYYYFLLYYVSFMMYPENRTRYFSLTLLLLALNFTLTSALMSIVLYINFSGHSFYKSKIQLGILSTFLGFIILYFNKIQLYLTHRLPSLELLLALQGNIYSMSSILYFASLNTNPTFRTITYYWSMLLHYLPFNFTGFGIGNFYSAYLEFNTIFPNDSASFMATNGGFLLVTLLVEFGSIFTVLFLIWYFSQFKKPSILLYASLSYLLFRGWGLAPMIFWALPLFSRPSIYSSPTKV